MSSQYFNITNFSRVADLRIAVGPNTGDKFVRLDFSQPWAWSQQGGSSILKYLGDELKKGEFDTDLKAPCFTSSSVDKAETTYSFATPSERKALEGWEVKI